MFTWHGHHPRIKIITSGRTKLGATSGGRRKGNGNATYLANVEVGAVILELGVVGEHGGGVGLVLVCDALDGVVGLNDVGRLAVAALETEAQVPADLEVGAEVVDGGVHGAELVPAEQMTPISMCSK